MDRDDRLNDFWSADDDATTHRVERAPSSSLDERTAPANDMAARARSSVPAKARRLVARLLEEDRKSLLDQVTLAERASKPPASKP
jgi:hypothetical protein